MLAGLFDMIVTFAAFAASQSTIILADFLKTTLEFVAVLLSFLALRRIRRGADHRYQYGVGKLENLSGLFISAIMVLCVVIVLYSASRSIHHEASIAGVGVWISMVAQAVYLLINGALSWRSQNVNRAHPSPVMASQARLFMTRALGNLFILLSLLLCLALRDFAWSHYIDPGCSVILALFMLFTASGIFRSSFQDLLDCTLEEEHQLIILRELARHFDHYDNLHGILSRRSGSHMFIDIFLEFAPEKRIAEVQPIINSLRKEIETQIEGSRVTIALTTEAQH